MTGETRKKIIEATEKLILLKGLSRVTTKEIARETGLSEGALYRHFNHKEEIFFALLLKHLPTLLDTFQTHQAGSATVQGNLIAIARAIISYYEQLIPMSASFLADMDLLEHFRTATRPLPGPQNVFIQVADYVEEEQKLGRISTQTSAMSTATLLLGPCFQYVFIRQLMGYAPFEKTEQQFAEELVQGLCQNILPS